MGWSKQKTILAVSVLLIMATSAGGGSARTKWENDYKRQIEQRINAQRLRLERIKQAAQARRQQIEDTYNAHLRNLQRRQDDFLSVLEKNVHNLFDGDRALLGEFVRSFTQLSSADLQMTMDRFFSQALDEVSLHKAAGYRLIPVIANGGLRPGTDIELKARELVQKAVDFEVELVELEEQKQAAIDRLAEWQNQQEQDVLRTIDTLKTNLEESVFGIVQAIARSAAASLILINDAIVYEGGRIEGVEVVKITEEKVGFRKNSNRWTQQVGEPAAEYWEN